MDLKNKKDISTIREQYQDLYQVHLGIAKEITENDTT
jgi:hypothetical protein